jgi:hypothetical protein
MSSSSDTLRSMFSPSKLEALERVSSALKADPKALDTHSREVRGTPKQENDSGKA